MYTLKQRLLSVWCVFYFHFYTDRLASALKHSPVARVGLLIEGLAEGLFHFFRVSTLQTGQCLSLLRGHARTEMVVHVLNSHVLVHVLNSHVRLTVREIRIAGARKAHT